MEKVSEPLDLITGWTCFGSNNLKQALWLAADQTCTTVRRNLGPFFLLNRLRSAIFFRCLVWTVKLGSGAMDTMADLNHLHLLTGEYLNSLFSFLQGMITSADSSCDQQTQNVF